MIILKKNIKTTHNNNNIKIRKVNKKRIINWSAYNQSLRNRGNLSIFISEALIHDGCLIIPNRTGKPGRPQKYADEVIEFTLTIRELFNLPLRQTDGFVAFLFRMMNITSGSPDYTTISKRMPGINVHYSRERSQSDDTANGNGNMDDSGSGIVLLIDSSGFKVFGEGEWKVRKHGADKHRTWRETHIAMDYSTRDILGLINTSAHAHDNTQLKPLLQQVIKEHGYKVETIIGDGAYEAKDNYKMVAEFQASIIAPPHKNAVYHYDLKDGRLIDVPGYEDRNRVIRDIMRAGGIEEWKDAVGYHKRSLVENAFYRWKTIFSDHLKSRKEGTQYTEQCLRAKIINRFNELGLPKYKTAS